MKKDLITLSLAILISSSVPLFPRWIDLSPQTIVFLRSLIAGGVTYIFWRMRGRNGQRPERLDAFRMIGLGLILGLHWITYFQAIQLAGVAVGMISFFTFPIMIVMIEPFFSKAGWQYGDLLLALLVFTGIIIMAPAFDPESNIVQGIFWGMISALFFSLRTIFSKKYVQQYDGITVMVYQFPAAALAAMPFYLVNPEPVSGINWVLLIILGLVGTTMGHILLVMSLDTLKPATYGILSASTPFLGVLWAMVVLQEYPDLKTILGGALVLGTAIFEAGRTLKQAEK